MVYLSQMLSSFWFAIGFFLVTALLRYNLHNIQFTHLKYTVQWFFLYSHRLVQLLLQLSLNIFITSKRNSISFSCHFLTSPHPPRPPGLSNSEPAFCPYRFSCSRQFMYLGSYHTCFFVIGFFHSAQCSPML